MSTKKPAFNALQAVLNQHNAVTAPPPVPSAVEEEQSAPAPAKKFSRPSREGKRLIAGHFTPAVAKQLKILAAEEETSVQDLLEQALELLFLKKGKGTIQKLRSPRTER